jgi:hypothetical protein
MVVCAACAPSLRRGDDLDGIYPRLVWPPFFLLFSSYPFSFFLGDTVSYILIIPNDEILIGFHGNGSQELCGSNGKLERAWKEWKIGIGASKGANASKQYNQSACPLSINN